MVCVPQTILDTSPEVVCVVCEDTDHGYQLSAIGYQLSAFGNQPSAIGLSVAADTGTDGWMGELSRTP